MAVTAIQAKNSSKSSAVNKACLPMLYGWDGTPSFTRALATHCTCWGKGHSCISACGEGGEKLQYPGWETWAGLTKGCRLQSAAWLLVSGDEESFTLRLQLSLCRRAQLWMALGQGNSGSQQYGFQFSFMFDFYFKFSFS